MPVYTTQAELRAAAHVDGVSFVCGDCGNTLPVQTSGGTGYGYWGPDGPSQKPICYPCCAKRQRAEMIETGKGTLYLNGKERQVTDWTGEIRFALNGIRKGSHNIAGCRYDIWFTGPDGKPWHGTQYGDNTQICRCKRVK